MFFYSHNEDLYIDAIIIVIIMLYLGIKKKE